MSPTAMDQRLVAVLMNSTPECVRLRPGKAGVRYTSSCWTTARPASSLHLPTQPRPTDARSVVPNPAPLVLALLRRSRFQNAQSSFPDAEALEETGSSRRPGLLGMLEEEHAAGAKVFGTLRRAALSNRTNDIKGRNKR